MAKEKEKEVDTQRGRRSKRSRRHTSSSSSLSRSSSSDYTSSSQSPDRESRKSKRKSTSRRHRESSHSHRKGRKSSRRSSHSGHKKDRREKEKKRSRRRRDDDSSGYSSMEEDSVKEKVLEPKEVVNSILSEFPAVASELHQILQMIDNGQGVDLSGISDKSLVKLLKKLFAALNLEKDRNDVYILPPKAVPTLDVIGSTLSQYINPEHASKQLESDKDDHLVNSKDEQLVNLNHVSNGEEEPQPAPRKKIIGPAMPSRELLEAAAQLTEAADLLREADVGEENEVLIGPPPPALVSEVESANEAERFEEVTRIMAADADSPYDVLGINWKMASENTKKKYWKLSLLVHPDKCPHPQAQQAFVILNKAFKDLQDPNKRGAIDDKLKAKEEQERFEVELKAMREAAQWRKIQGISMEGDEELLAGPKEEAPKREEWMTTLPPERKPGMPMHSTTSFSRSGKEGRGDTSAWTDTPLDKANKAKQNYLEAYDKAKALADAEEARSQPKPTSDASLVDKYNASKRAMSLVEKHREDKKKEKKSEKQKGNKGKEKEEWEGNHPWKPWDREKDLTAGRKSVNLDPKSMSQGLTSRFSGGTTQRNFL
ncbi:DNAJ heat shock N-terminal domain-containing protein-like [Rhynchospora pubera]|uniref:DNAJ heat shock N-terminal domain-containing protein-like n=1 Tax=Rhynchospora pubera TaxID=906938 RepID=A0AAV8GZ69_9POAL|nr:DNAJ heat shock N-terminal domain-containing protein-like [Rhynchospora pubera]